MYKISVPVMNSNVSGDNREKTLRELRRFDAERVFLALDTYETDVEKRRKVMESLTDNCRFFKENGFEVGAWIWTFWVKDNKTFKNMRTINGSEITEFMCPTDESFVKFAADYIGEIARCGVDIIQFDDDFRYGFLGESTACLCDNHIDAINIMTNDSLTREEIREHILNGSKNKWRDAWLKVNGDAFRNFARTVRASVDEVDPKIRMGACACISSWDVDGTDAAELSRILAGKTKPFVRLIGAPYWATTEFLGNQLQDVVELERMESSWTKAEDIEIMAEGDVYPRPRTRCPAIFLEGFDTAIRASGCTDGILKYGIDYISDADYETGYAKYHERHKNLYKDIDRIFGNKKHCGVRVYESMKKVGDTVNPTKVNTSVDLHDFFFPKISRTLAYNTIPTTYEGEGVCGAVFDENARHIPDEALKNGLILDIAAAEILMQRGIDIGIKNIGEKVSAGVENFVGDGQRISTFGISVYNIDLKERAEILSCTETAKGTVPMSYRYENADGNRFLVLNVNTREKECNCLKHYARSLQFANEIKWLSGNTLPAYSYGNPALYIQCKRNDNSMAVGLWNFFADSIFEPVIELDNEYSEIEFVNCEGRLEKNKVYLSDIPPFGFAFFEVKLQ